jgi:hypothetical protein
VLSLPIQLRLLHEVVAPTTADETVACLMQNSSP